MTKFEIVALKNCMPSVIYDSLYFIFFYICFLLLVGLRDSYNAYKWNLKVLVHMSSIYNCRLINWYRLQKHIWIKDLIVIQHVHLKIEFIFIFHYFKTAIHVPNGAYMNIFPKTTSFFNSYYIYFNMVSLKCQNVIGI